jgi:hypothetical protein
MEAKSYTEISMNIVRLLHKFLLFDTCFNFEKSPFEYENKLVKCKRFLTFNIMMIINDNSFNIVSFVHPKCFNMRLFEIIND